MTPLELGLKLNTLAERLYDDYALVRDLTVHAEAASDPALIVTLDDLELSLLVAHGLLYEKSKAYMAYRTGGK